MFVCYKIILRKLLENNLIFINYKENMSNNNKIQTGINNAVNWIKINANPSIPKTKLILTDWNQGLISKNWNCVAVGSKKNKSEKLTFKINKDQNNEKLRIKLSCVFSIKAKMKQPIIGKEIRNNNI